MVLDEEEIEERRKKREKVKETICKEKLEMKLRRIMKLNLEILRLRK